jgi:hypothetical protein
VNATVTLTEQEQFFYDHAGWSYNPAAETPEHGRAAGAVLLARAETGLRRAPGTHVTWEPDPDADNEPADGYYVSGHPQWQAALVRYAPERPDANGDGNVILASLGGIDLGDDGLYSAYRRVIEAELALEAL